MNELTLVDRILVPHTAFKKAIRGMNHCYAYAEAGALEPVCMALIGPSRSGKSRTLQFFCEAHPDVRLAEGLVRKVLFVTVPSVPTVKAIVELMLKELGDPLWNRGSVTEQTIRLNGLMIGCRVLVLILDEFQHFYDKASQKVQHDVADWLKVLVIVTKVALVVSGLPTLRAVIDQNEQFAGRMSKPIEIPRYDWLKHTDREEWIAILESFSEGIRSAFDVPNLGGDEIAFRLYYATGGLLGYLARTLRQAVWNAIEAESKSISMADLHTAHQDAVWSEGELATFTNPLDVEELLIPSIDLIERSKLIGTRIATEATPRRARRVRKQDGQSPFGGKLT